MVDKDVKNVIGIIPMVEGCQSVENGKNGWIVIEDNRLCTHGRGEGE